MTHRQDWHEEVIAYSPSDRKQNGAYQCPTFGSVVSVFLVDSIMGEDKPTYRDPTKVCRRCA